MVNEVYTLDCLRKQFNCLVSHPSSALDILQAVLRISKIKRRVFTNIFNGPIVVYGVDTNSAFLVTGLYKVSYSNF